MIVSTDMQGNGSERRHMKKAPCSDLCLLTSDI
jgi:hypothetical protein